MKVTGHRTGPVGHTAGAVARRLGIVPSTLRTWNRRYGIGPAGHESGRYRYYTEDDVAEVARMQALIAEGTPAVVAATIARTRRAGPPRSPVPDSARPPRTRRAVQAAAMRLDASTVARALEHSVEAAGVLATWHRLYRPIMARVGQRVCTAGDCLDVERSLSWAMIAALHRVPAPARGTRGPRVLLACADGERHSVGLEVVRAALAERGLGTEMLGAAVATDALDAALARRRVDAVLLAAQTPRHARVSTLARLSARAGTVIAGGPGWADRALPAPVAHAPTVEQAVRRLERAGRPGNAPT